MAKKKNKPSFSIHPSHIFIVILLLVLGGAVYFYFQLNLAHRISISQSVSLTEQLNRLKQLEAKTKKELEVLKKSDPYAENDKLKKQVEGVEKTFAEAVKTYEELIKLRELTKDTAAHDIAFTNLLIALSEKDYTSANAIIVTLKRDIAATRTKVLASFTIPANTPVSSSPPGSGYSRQQVQTEFGTFLVDIIAGDLGSTKVIVDTASDGTCANDCPVDSLGNYAARSGAYAGINGPYFCPAEYPSCAGKTNSFDTLIMNKNKVFFNSDNNVYSVVPGVAFYSGSARFVGRTLEWGKDSGADSFVAAQPMLLSGGNVVFGGDDEAKRSGSGTRAFIANKGNIAYIGLVHNANVAQVARVLKTLGLENALNLDSGGSIALWYQGRYVAGPGRNTPFGILFVNR